MLGTAVGDCLGRPMEGRRHVPEEYLDGLLTSPPALIYTDDTLMSALLAGSLLQSDGFSGADMAARFARAYEMNPNRGYGGNIVKVFEAVLAGQDWAESARRQFNGGGSYGNGGAMRVAPVALWAFPDVDLAAQLAAETARVTHTHPVGVEGAVIQAVAACHALGSDPSAPFNTEALLDDLDSRVHTDTFRHQLEILPRLLSHDDDGKARFHLGNWVAADESVVTALYCFLLSADFPDAIVRAIRMAGDADTIAAMCGALAGARHGAAAIPEAWRDVEGVDDLVSLADDLHARDSQAPAEVLPVEASTAPTRASRVRGLLLGGAVGDALGAPVEFSSLAGIVSAHGPNGITSYAPSYGGRRGTWTDDTQMTLFTAEALVGAAATGTDVEAAIWAAYKRWHHTQVGDGPMGGGLAAIPGMHSRRAPGSTCIAASSAPAPGTVDQRINDSKGCGGVMRVAPIGAIAVDPFGLANAAAAMTHGHPSGWLSSGALAVMISALMDGAGRHEAVAAGLEAVRAHPESGEVVAALEAAIALAAEAGPSPSVVERLGGGWIAEEALAIAVYCFLVASDFSSAVILGANHSGDSDSTASIAGQLYGTWAGAEAIPAHWLDELEMAGVITELASDLAAI